jgi:NAD(P)-dependent dehydrogenase (short-subunit alcohol dehydrogenase family)
MPGSNTAVVTGGASGLGLGIAKALAAKDMHVIALGRDAAKLQAAAKAFGAEPIVADAADEATAASILQERQPGLVVLCAGAKPLLRPLHLHTWETFSLNWQVDAKQAFVWLRNALLLPMAPGSHVIIVSSMAAAFGSPLSGGYAGAKRMQWMMAQYAQAEIERQKLGIRVHCLLPTLSPNTDLGRAAVAAYAARTGVSFDEYVSKRGALLTAEIIGRAVVEIHENLDPKAPLAYQIGGDGLKPMN